MLFSTYPVSDNRRTYRKIISTVKVWLYVLVMSCTRFRVNPHFIVARMLRSSLLEPGAKSEV